MLMHLESEKEEVAGEDSSEYKLDDKVGI